MNAPGLDTHIVTFVVKAAAEIESDLHALAGFVFVEEGGLVFDELHFDVLRITVIPNGKNKFTLGESAAKGLGVHDDLDSAFNFECHCLSENPAGLKRRGGGFCQLCGSLAIRFFAVREKFALPQSCLRGRYPGFQGGPHFPFRPGFSRHRAAMKESYTQRFGGMGRLFGRDGMKRLEAAHVCVIGVGGVGSWSVEALARSGIGRLTLIDMDDVCITNTNRQLPALSDTLGRTKVDVLAERMRLIHPECAVRPVTEFLLPSNADRLLAEPYDFVIDAVDRMTIKALIIARCRTAGTPVLTVGGAGGRRDATAVRCADLAKSGGDELLRLVRRQLRREYGFPSGEGALFHVPCVYSAESQVFPWSDGVCRHEAERGESLKMDCASGFGAATFVTGAFGFAAAGEVVRLIAGGAPK